MGQTKKEIKGKIIFKHETEANWAQSNYVPYLGEQVLYDPDFNCNYVRVKYGNGTSKVKDLPFDTDKITERTVPVLVLNGADAPDFSKLELYFIVRLYREVGSRYSGHQKLEVNPMNVTGEMKAVFNTVHLFRDGANRIDREQLRVCNKMSDHSIRVFFQYFNGDTVVEMVSPGVNKNIYLTKDMDYVVVESY